MDGVFRKVGTLGDHRFTSQMMLELITSLRGKDNYSPRPPHKARKWQAQYFSFPSNPTSPSIPVISIRGGKFENDQAHPSATAAFPQALPRVSVSKAPQATNIQSSWISGLSTKPASNRSAPTVSISSATLPICSNSWANQSIAIRSGWPTRPTC